MRAYQTTLKTMSLERLEIEINSLCDAPYINHSEREIKISAVENEMATREKEIITAKTKTILEKDQ